MFPIGSDLNVSIIFKNETGASVTIEDPVTHMNTALLYRDEDSIEDELVLLNPGNVDTSGEMTASNSSKINLTAQDAKEKLISVFDLFPENRFGREFEIQVGYKDAISAPLKIRTVIVPQSVLLLLDIIADATVEVYFRKMALKHLKAVPIGFENGRAIYYSDWDRINFSKDVMPIVESFRMKWNAVKDLPEIDAFFKQKI